MDLTAFPAQAAYGEYQAESAPWGNLYACGDCASRVDAMLMGTTTLPRAAPLAANPTFYQMPQKVSNMLVKSCEYDQEHGEEYGIRYELR